MRFRFAQTAIDTAAARREVTDRGAGGYVSFEGWVRDHNAGREVTGLEYEAFEALAIHEGDRILTEALARFPIKHAVCIHRVGTLDLTELAVWVGVSSAHRGEAFDACRFIIDEVKHRLPIWKKEHYRSGDSGWVNCERCAAPPSLPGGPAQAHVHVHVHALADAPTHADAPAQALDEHALAGADAHGHANHVDANAQGREPAPAAAAQAHAEEHALAPAAAHARAHENARADAYTHPPVQAHDNTDAYAPANAHAHARDRGHDDA